MIYSHSWSNTLHFARDQNLKIEMSKPVRRFRIVENCRFKCIGFPISHVCRSPITYTYMIASFMPLICICVVTETVLPTTLLTRARCTSTQLGPISFYAYARPRFELITRVVREFVIHASCHRTHRLPSVLCKHARYQPRNIQPFPIKPHTPSPTRYRHFEAPPARPYGFLEGNVQSNRHSIFWHPWVEPGGWSRTPVRHC